MTKPAFRQHDLRRAIKAYVDATGKTPGPIEVTVDGTIRIMPPSDAPQVPVDQFDLIDMRSR